MEALAATALSALSSLLQISHLAHLVLGVLVGLAVGILPGIGGMAGMALVLPFLYGMDPTSALAMIVGLTSVTNTSDTIPAVLLGVPGTASAQATVMDGYPLAQKGEAGRALSAAFAASMAGGIFGALVLTLAVAAAHPLLLAFGFAEQLMLLLLSLGCVGMLTGSSPTRGLAACALGLLLGSVGLAPATAEPRMTFGALYLVDGVPLVPVGLGLFAVPEILTVLRFRDRIAPPGRLGATWRRGLYDAWAHRGVILRCSGLGALLGAVPGIGGSVIDWLAYGHVRQSAADRSGFGQGDIRGVIAPESANNAKEGGALIPTLLFGIPGSGTMAMFLSAMVVIGVDPGRGMIEDDMPLTFVIVWSIALANIAGAGISALLAIPLAWIVTIRYSSLAPFIIVTVVFAAYQATGAWGDVGVLIVFGVVGASMARFGWSRPAFLIGFVLASSLEDAYYRTTTVYGASFLARPLTLVLLAALIVLLVASFRGRASEAAADPDCEGVRDRRREGAYAAAWLIAPAVALADAAGLRAIDRMFPATVAVVCAGLLLAILASSLRRSAAPRPVGQPPDALPVEALPVEALPVEAHPAGPWRPDAVSADRPRRTTAALGLAAGLLAVSAFVGYTLGAALFVAVFLRAVGGARWRVAAASAAGIAAVLWTLTNLLRLEAPSAAAGVALLHRLLGA